jgi:LPS-assembly lipoprotein
VRAVDQRGKVIDYELTYKVSFDVQDAEGKELVSPQAITLVRTQVDPGVEVLGKQEEQTLFFSDMQREMVGRILRRVKIQLR